MVYLYNNFEIFQFLCKSANKWGLRISIPTPDDWTPDEIWSAAPFLKEDHRGCYFIGEGQAIFLFDTEEEMLEYFSQVVGDDGPTLSNPYDGPCRIYALTCSPDGELLNENT